VKRRLLAAALILGALYFLLLGGDYTFFDLWRLGRDYDREVAELEAVRVEVAELRARTDSLASDSAALERLARERFGMIRDGERLYRFVEPGDSGGDHEREPPS